MVFFVAQTDEQTLSFPVFLPTRLFTVSISKNRPLDSASGHWRMAVCSKNTLALQPQLYDRAEVLGL